jgi:hypothetical protein
MGSTIGAVNSDLNVSRAATIGSRRSSALFFLFGKGMGLD